MISRRKIRNDLEKHFEIVRTTAHSIVQGQQTILDLPMSDRWKGFYENTRRLGRNYLPETGGKK